MRGLAGRTRVLAARAVGTWWVLFGAAGLSCDNIAIAIGPPLQAGPDTEPDAGGGAPGVTGGSAGIPDSGNTGGSVAGTGDNGGSAGNGVAGASGQPASTCGNGRQEEDEVCDDGGDPTPGFACNDSCSARLGPSCGDGIVSPAVDGSSRSPEVCDDGPFNGIYCDDCRGIIGSCGDGLIQFPFEQCDAKGESANCNADCTRTDCGDERVNRAAGEACDDGRNDGLLGSCLLDCSGPVHQADAASANSCKALLAEGWAEQSGLYWLVSSEGDPYIAYCDLASDGGGWTLIMRAIESNFEYNDPFWSNSALEAPESFDFSTPGTRSKYRAYLEVPFTEIRTSDSKRDRFAFGYTARSAFASAVELFGANGGAGIGISLASGEGALVPYFNDRVIPTNRQWGCSQFTHVGLNLEVLLDIQMEDRYSAGGTSFYCDWDGGARFGQRVNACRFHNRGDCAGDHQGQGWGNFRTTDGVYDAEPISNLLWVR